MLKRKDKILISALELLEEGGINNVTTKNLAARQGVTEPALYRQYKNKDEIFVAIIKAYSSYDVQIMDTIKEKHMKCDDGITYYVTMFAELYQNYSELSTILYSMDVYFYNETTKRMIVDMMDKRNDFLVSWLSENASKTCQYNPTIMARLINDTLQSEIFIWRMKDKTYDLVKAVINLVNHIM